MRFGRRSTAGPRASYAAVVGERYLWVALGETYEVSLQDIEMPVETDASQPGHHGTRLDLADLPPGRHRVLAGGRALLGPQLRETGPGTALALERDDDEHLHVLRRPPVVGATVRAMRLRGERVEIDLDLGTGTGTELRLGTGITVALDEGTAVLTPAHLATVAAGDLAVTVEGRPVRRRANDLSDPGAGALLPAVHPVGAAQALARLRWSAEGTLMLRVLRVLRDRQELA